MRFGFCFPDTHHLKREIQGGFKGGKGFHLHLKEQEKLGVDRRRGGCFPSRRKQSLEGERDFLPQEIRLARVPQERVMGG